ncbi:hypothetical protein [Planktothrix sp. FACHB-1365]|uniref:hypothetical protein n=1 Tax=Planktothrix sp. FACHB-1365 TaxID=2692855 RepID=UPI001F553EBE|nr:hypothetical protein [Planktothrix sp. FACHB-1365]
MTVSILPLFILLYSGLTQLIDAIAIKQKLTSEKQILTLEVLSWYNQQGVRYLTPEERLALYRERFGEL